ncbi:NAD(P)-binding protein [Paraphaeosphaeria sporulosa]|uniref:NAD(P)-binding protein n=1 Tax=Paraphaeosphaeria sporulosa TaxID=1460663 RepID=A0A177CZI3_9PLEO|nr:NAD(P)-binding protein [Paraphaeosphaeria sporulosa]OAG12367.1 NAD(P)-binding protein [Paraphaeosphaeria sporulosa]
MDFSNSALPAHYGLNFTPTFHSRIPANISHTASTLPQPFVVVVTGAGKGLGYHISLEYARAGCSALAISSRTESDLDKLEGEIASISKKNVAAGGGREIEVLKVVADVQSDADVARLEQEVRAKWGRVDVVIANAGVISAYITPSSPEESNLPRGIVQDGDWARVLDINLNGVWRVSKAFVPLLAQTKDGPQTIIASCSMAAHSVVSDLTPIAYNVSKAAVMRLMECVANDHRKEGVQAFALHPGAVVTPQTKNHAGNNWTGILADDEGLAGAFCVWLSKQKRAWLSGRFVSCNWDVEELEKKKDEIVKGDLLKYRMVV